MRKEGGEKLLGKVAAEQYGESSCLAAMFGKVYFRK